jgi:uncharacterized membrane protein YkoI
MIRFAALLIALTVAAQPLDADAQARFGRSFGAAESPSEPGSRLAQRSGQTISMEQAVAIVARRTPGRLLDASPAGSNYRIVWITPDGRRIDFLVDASSGAILRSSGGD